MDRVRATTAEEHPQAVGTGRRRADRDPVHLIGVNRDQVARHPLTMRHQPEPDNARGRCQAPVEEEAVAPMRDPEA